MQKKINILQNPWKHTHSHTHPFNGPLSRTTRVSRYQKGKPIWILLNQETVSGSGISWTICKSALRSRQIDNHASTPPLSFFTGRMPFLPPNQQRQSTEGKIHGNLVKKIQLSKKKADRQSILNVKIMSAHCCQPAIKKFCDGSCIW